jgi:hypothetical protein
MPASTAAAPSTPAGVWYPLRMLQSGVRPVQARVHTTEFRVDGSFHLRETAGTAWLLNGDDRPYLPMTGISVYKSGVADAAPGDLLYETEFAAVPKAQVRWLTGGAPDATQQGHGRQPRTVYLLYADHVLTGSFHVRPELRLSDFIGQTMQSKPFLTLFEAHVLLPGASGTPISKLPPAQSHDFVTVNLRLVGGVFDRADVA